MIPTLYEPFRHWSEGGSIFILSDLHFDDEDCRLMDPDWISPEEQLAIINKTVAKGDTSDYQFQEMVFRTLSQPNIIWTKNKPLGYEESEKKENKVILIFERVGQALVTVLVLIFSSKDESVKK